MEDIFLMWWEEWQVYNYNYTLLKKKLLLNGVLFFIHWSSDGILSHQSLSITGSWVSHSHESADPGMGG